MTAKEFDGIVWDKRSTVIFNGVEHRVQGVQFKHRFVILASGETGEFGMIELPNKIPDEPKPRLCRDGGACLKPDMECKHCVLNE